MSKDPDTTKTRPWFEAVEIGHIPSVPSRIIFVTLSFILVLSTVLFGAVDPATWAILSILTLGVALCWFFEGWRRHRFLINRDSLLLPLIGLIAIGIIQLMPLFAPQLPPGLVTDAPRSTISLDPYATRLFVVRLVVYLVFFAAALTFINRMRRLKAMVLLIIVFGSLMAFFAILQRLGAPDAIYGIRVPSQAIPFGSFVNQHHFAAFMEMTGGIVTGLLLAGGVKRELRIMLIFSLVLMGIAVVMTSSRGGLLSFVGTLLFVTIAGYALRPGGRKRGEPREHRLKLLIGASAVVAIMLLVFGVVLMLGADSSLVRGIGLSPGSDVSNGRLHFWSVALKVIAEHPLLGAGLDAFGVAFTKFDTWNGTFRIEQAHNDYLQSLADAGIAGFACVASFIFLLFKKGLAMIVSSTDQFRRAAAIGALAGCFGIMIHSFFDFPLRTPSNAFFFLTLAAIAVVSVRSGQRHRTLTASSF